MRNNVQPKQSKPQKENKQVLDLSPFVARAMAEKREAWGDIDKAFGENPGAFTDALKEARTHLAYYKEQDVETEWYSLKAAAIINLATETTTVRGKKAGAAVAAILKKHWPHIYGYIEKAEEPVDFDKFWIDSNSAIKINRPGKSQIIPTGGSLPDKASSWDGRFAVFFYTANVQGKKTAVEKPIHVELFTNHCRERDRIKIDTGNICDYGFVPTGRETAVTNELWKHIEKSLGKIPDTLGEYFASPYSLANKDKNGYLFSSGKFAGLPIGAMKSAFVSSGHLRREVELYAHLLPEDTREVTEEMKEEALRQFAQVLVLRSAALVYRKTRSYALKYFELKNAAQIVKSSDEAAIEIEFLQKKLKQTQKQSSYDEEEAEKREKALREELTQKEKIAKELKNINEYADKKIAEQEAVIKDLLQALNSTEKLRETPLLPPGASAIAAAKKVVIVGGKNDWPPNVKDKYRNFTFFTVEDKVDADLLDKANYIVISWEYAAHEAVGRIKLQAKKKNKRLLYLLHSGETQLLTLIYRECAARGEVLEVP